MGLGRLVNITSGKTIMVIAFLSALYTKYDLFPFLVVVPNSTAGNWYTVLIDIRAQEFSKWAPQLEFATFSGSSAARDIVKNFEMFPKSQSDSKFKNLVSLKCHVIITTYDCVRTEKSALSKTDWKVLVVDEV